MGAGGSKSKRYRRKNIRPPSMKHNLQDHVVSMLRKCMYQLPFPPHAVTEEAVQKMAMRVETLNIVHRQEIIVKGERAKGIFLLIKGQGEVLSSDDSIIAPLLPGDFFGELSSMFYIPCTATVRIKEESQLLLIKMEQLRKVMGHELVVSMKIDDYFVDRNYFDTSNAVPQCNTLARIAKHALKKIPLFSTWRENALNFILETLTTREMNAIVLIPPEQYIVMDGDTVDEITVITRGTVDVLLDKELIAELDSSRWPVWFGEQEHFSGSRSAITVRTGSACQAIKIKFSDIAEAFRRYKNEIGPSLRYWNEKWRIKVQQLHKVGLFDKNIAESHNQVLIKRLYSCNVFSSAPIGLFHQIAIAALPRQCSMGDSIYESKLGIPRRSSKKGKKKDKKKASLFPISLTLEDAERYISDKDRLFLVLNGLVEVLGIQNFTYEEGRSLWISSSSGTTSSVVAKSDVLVLQVSGLTLLQACRKFSEVRLNLPPALP